MANIITLSRILLSFIVVFLLFFNNPEFYVSAFLLTAIIIWFDGLDGYVARKFHEESKFGAFFDILGDRIVENIYWITFACFHWIPLWIPIIVMTRGLLTDGVRSMASQEGYTPFGKNTMMQSKIGKFIVASNFSRGLYAVAKAFAFTFIILCHMPKYVIPQDILTGSINIAQQLPSLEYANFWLKMNVFLPKLSLFAYICVYTSVILCILRGLPVLIEAKRFFKKDEK